MADEDGGIPEGVMGSSKMMGMYIRARVSYEGYEDAQELTKDIEDVGKASERTQAQMDAAGRSSMRQSMQYRMLGMSAIGAAGSFAQMAGASREQMQVFQMLNAILMVTITLYTILDIVSGGASMAAGGGLKAGAGLLKGMGGLARASTMHQGGYGSDQLAVIQSNERVVPSYRIMTNYGGNINIGTMVLTGGSGKDLARDFTEQLESFKQRGSQNPEWS